MARRPLRFTERDLVRALKAALKAHLPIARIRIETGGAIEIIPGKPEDMAASPAPNPWDVS